MVTLRECAGRVVQLGGNDARVSEQEDTRAPGEHAVTPDRAAALIEGGATLIDVRRHYEYEGGHLPGAANVEMNELPGRSSEIPRDAAVLFYCRTGNRSSMAVDAFREAGYEAHNPAGGIEAWVADGRMLAPEGGEVRAPPPPSS
jgi:rhodanese-related sulfurtransferase